MSGVAIEKMIERLPEIISERDKTERESDVLVERLRLLNQTIDAIETLVGLREETKP